MSKKEILSVNEQNCHLKVIKNPYFYPLKILIPSFAGNSAT